MYGSVHFLLCRQTGQKWPEGFFQDPFHLQGYCQIQSGLKAGSIYIRLTDNYAWWLLNVLALQSQCH